MVKRYVTETQEVTVPEGFECDVCHTVHLVTDQMGIEEREAVYISQQAGYGSVFGDGNVVEVDICQHCVQKLLGPYLRIIELPDYGQGMTVSSFDWREDDGSA